MFLRFKAGCTLEDLKPDFNPDLHPGWPDSWLVASNFFVQKSTFVCCHYDYLCCGTRGEVGGSVHFFF